MSRFVAAGFSALVCLASPAFGQNAAPALSEVGLGHRIEALAASEGSEFELGILQTLRAVERALQTGYDYGANDGILEIPVLRLFGHSPNPDPLPFTPESIAKGVKQFLVDLEQARAYLDRIPADADQSFELTLQDIWFDIDSDGAVDQTEGAIELLAPQILGRRGMQALRDGRLLAEPVTIRFDAADQAWLKAYTHMLSGVGEAILAFDPAPVIAELQAGAAILQAAPEIPNPFDQSAVRARVAQLQSDRQEIQNTLGELQNELFGLRREIKDAEDGFYLTSDEDAKAALRSRITAANARIAEIDEMRSPLWQRDVELRREIDSETSKLTVEMQSFSLRTGFETEIDSIYVLFKALRQNPDLGHAQAVRRHWLEMIEQNRVFWAQLGKETDNDREWIPNPGQTSALPLTLPDNAEAVWLDVLGDAENVLNGELLIPHPLLPQGYGVNLGAWFDNPSSLDLVDWIHGRGAYPYAARGPHISGRNWRTFDNLVSGNAAGFAIFLN